MKRLSKDSTRIFDLRGKSVGRIHLPAIFNTPLRPDVIKRTVVALQSHRFQPQGRDILAGKRTSAESRGVGLGISRVPRLKGGSRRAAFASSAVGGRTTHPPLAKKKIKKKVPRKEMRLALRSAVAATASKEAVSSRGHIIDDVPELPLVVVDEIQNLQRTQEALEALIQLGVWSDIYRVKESIKIRPGKGKRRGRRKKQAVGPLLVITKDEGVVRAARNFPGVDVTNVESLNAELLAPGARPGRLTVWANSSVEKLDSLFGWG